MEIKSEQNENYKVFYDLSHNSQMIIKDYKIFDCNKETEILFRKDRKDIVGKEIYEFMISERHAYNEVKEMVDKLFDEVRKKGYKEFEKKLLDKNVYTVFRMTYKNNGNNSFFYVEIEDKTQEKTNKDLTNKLKLNFDTIYGKSLILLASLDLEGYIVECSEYLKKSLAKICDNKIINIFELLKVDPLYVIENGSIEKEIFIEGKKDKLYKELRNQGISCLWIKIDVIKNNDDILTGFVLQINNISKSKEYEKKILQQNNLLNKVINLMPSGLIVKDVRKDLEYIYFNQTAKKIFKINDNIELVGKKHTDVFSEDVCDNLEGMNKSFLNSEGISEKLLHFDSIKKGCLLKITCIPVKNNKGINIYLIFIIDDVSEINKKNEHDKQRGKMAALGQLAGGVAHDFNNQLMSIIGNAMMLQKSDDLTKIREYAERIVHISKSSANLTKKILLFSRKGSNIYTDINLKKVLENVSTIIESILDKRIVIDFKYNAQKKWIKGDEAQIENLFINLAINSRDAMKNGGIIKIIAEDATYTDKRIMSHGESICPGEYIKIIFEDTGKGMSDATLSRMFEPYFSTKNKKKGTGLGLSVVFGTIKSHEGYVNVKSEKKVGTTFEIFLPIAEKERKEEKKSKENKVNVNISGDSNKILIVDDDKNVLDIEAELFEDLGYDVVKYNKPIKALSSYKKIWKEIDIVALDMIMPELDGRELFALMKKINPDVKAIFISGYSVGDEKIKALEEGALAFLEKPFTFEQISEVLSKIV